MKKWNPDKVSWFYMLFFAPLVAAIVKDIWGQRVLNVVAYILVAGFIFLNYLLRKKEIKKKFETRKSKGKLDENTKIEIERKKLKGKEVVKRGRKRRRR